MNTKRDYQDLDPAMAAAAKQYHEAQENFAKHMGEPAVGTALRAKGFLMNGRIVPFTLRDRAIADADALLRGASR